MRALVLHVPTIFEMCKAGDKYNGRPPEPTLAVSTKQQIKPARPVSNINEPSYEKNLFLHMQLQRGRLTEQLISAFCFKLFSVAVKPGLVCFGPVGKPEDSFCGDAAHL